jgi:hypothetical protein
MARCRWVHLLGWAKLGWAHLSEVMAHSIDAAFLECSLQVHLFFWHSCSPPCCPSYCLLQAQSPCWCIDFVLSSIELQIPADPRWLGRSLVRIPIVRRCTPPCTQPGGEPPQVQLSVLHLKYQPANVPLWFTPCSHSNRATPTFPTTVFTVKNVR